MENCKVNIKEYKGLQLLFHLFQKTLTWYDYSSYGC